MTYPCDRCNMDEGSPVCLQDKRCPSRSEHSTRAWRDMAVAAGWKDTPTVRQAFWAFSIEDFAQRVAMAERERWERALKQTWQAIDPLKPAGQPGSYARGYDNGFAAALAVLRGNLGA